MINIIVPVMNEISNLDKLLERLAFTVKEYGKFEIIFVDDGSTDGTREKLEEISKKYNFVKVIFFTKNFGHQMALLAGMEYSKGEIIITIDGDLQDPPELIHDLIRIYKDGYKIVNTYRNKREGEKLWRIILIKLFYFFTDLMNLGIINNSGDFRLMHRTALNELISYPYKKFFIRALIAKIRFKQFNLQYNRKPRSSGQAKGGFIWLIKFGIDCLIAANFLPKIISSSPDTYEIEKIINDH